MFVFSKFQKRPKTYIYKNNVTAALRVFLLNCFILFYCLSNIDVKYEIHLSGKLYSSHEAGSAKTPNPTLNLSHKFLKIYCWGLPRFFSNKKSTKDIFVFNKKT